MRTGSSSATGISCTPASPSCLGQARTTWSGGKTSVYRAFWQLYLQHFQKACLAGTQFDRRHSGLHVLPARTFNIVFRTANFVVWLDHSSSCSGCTRMRLVMEMAPPRVRPPSRRRTTSRHGWRCSSRRRPDVRAGARECWVLLRFLSLQALPIGFEDGDCRTAAEHNTG